MLFWGDREPRAETETESRGWGGEEGGCREGDFRVAGSGMRMATAVKAEGMTAVRVLRLAKETTLVLGMTLFLPFLVHLLPSWDDSPLGAHLLPIFYAPLAALLMGRMGIALGVSLAAPWINHLLTGMPPVPMAMMLCLQLVLFLLVAQILHRRQMPPFSLGPLGYAAALLFSCALGSLLGLAGVFFPLQLAGFPGALFTSLPGILLLAVIGHWFGRQPHAPA